MAVFNPTSVDPSGPVSASWVNERDASGPLTVAVTHWSPAEVNRTPTSW